MTTLVLTLIGILLAAVASIVAIRCVVGSLLIGMAARWSFVGSVRHDHAASVIVRAKAAKWRIVGRVIHAWLRTTVRPTAPRLPD